jgi:hypothetical protein
MKSLSWWIQPVDATHYDPPDRRSVADESTGANLTPKAILKWTNSATAPRIALPPPRDAAIVRLDRSALREWLE